MADEQLRMIATLTDAWSPQLKQMQRSLRSLAAETGGFHKQGITSSKSHTESLLALRREVTAVGDRVRGTLAPAFGALGISSLSAAAGLGAVAAAVKEFAGSAQHLKFLSRETGLSVNKLRELEELAVRVGSSAEAMDQGLRGFGATMNKLSRAPLLVLRETFEALNVRPDPQVISGWRNLITSMQGLPRFEQFEKIVQFLDRIRDVDQKEAVLKAFGLPMELARKSARELREELEHIEKIQKPWSDADVAAGVKAKETFEDLRLTLRQLGEDLGRKLTPAVAELAQSFAEFSNAHLDDIAAGIGEVVKRLRELGNSELLANMRAFALATDKAVESTTGWFPILAAFTAFRVAKLFGIASGISAIATSVSALTALASPPAWLLSLLGLAGSVAADRDRQQRGEKGPGGLYGTPLYGFGPMGEPDLIPQGPEDGFRGNQGDKGEAAPAGKPLWRRLFDSINQEGGLLHKSSFEVPDDWKGALKSPGMGAGDPRGAEAIIERGVLQALRDFAAETKGDTGGGGGMGAIRANYSPGGGGGYSGAGAGTGEPGIGGGAGTGGGAGSAPMGKLPRLGDLPGGGDDYGRIADAIGKQEGYGRPGTIATDQNNPGNLKWGPFAQAHGATGPGRGGHAIFPDAASGRSAMIDLLKSPKYAGKSIAEIGRTYAEDPKWGAAVARGAGVSPSYIPGSAAAGGGQYTGVGGYNFMGSARAAAMGMGDVTHGGPLAHLRWPTGIPEGEGPTSIMANKYAGRDMAGFLKDLHDAGAPLKQFAGAYVNKPLQHGYGNALDIETGFGSGPNNSPLLYAWAQKHPKEFAEIQAKHHMRNLDTSSGARMHDWGHFEWTPEAKSAAIAGSNAAKSMPNIGAAIGGTAQDGIGSERIMRPDDYGSEWHAWNQAEKQRLLDQISGRFHEQNDVVGGMVVPKDLRGRSTYDRLKTEEKRMELGIGGSGGGPDERLRPRGREQRASYDLLGHAREAGLVGAPLNHKVTGSASVDIRLANFPKGTVSKASGDGMFKQIKLSRGRAMPAASQES
jgi:hypothetical protein